MKKNQSTHRQRTAMEQQRPNQYVGFFKFFCHFTVKSFDFSVQRREVNNDEGQLTDDEDNSTGNVLPTSEDRIESDKMIKRRRTGNYQNILSNNTNGNHLDEKTTTTTTTNGGTTSTNRRILDYGTNHSTTTTTTTDSNTTSTVKTRFNIPSINRGLNTSYDPSQSPLFSVTSRVSRTGTKKNIFEL